MTREEWVRRYAARLMERSDFSEPQAMEVAEIGAHEHEQNERAANNAIDWNDPMYRPEDMADEEMSYWDNDE